MILPTRLPLALATLFFSVIINVDASCPLTDPIAIDRDGTVFLEQSQTAADGTYTMRLTYVGGHAWIGIGRNKWGLNHMNPAVAVIGRSPDHVQFYEMDSDAEDGSGVLPTATNTLQNASFAQTVNDDDEEVTTLTFTQDLEEMGVKDSSVWIFAVGLPDNQWAGKHKIHGGFKLALTDCQGSGSDKEGELVEVPTIPPEMHGPSHDDPEEEVEEGVSEGGTTGTSSSSIVFLDTSHPNQSLWLAHGILLAIAWGILAPCAIGASLLRRQVTAYLGTNWYAWHLYLNVGVVLLTTVGFILAVVATEKEDEPHFRVDGSDNDQHQKVGLAVFILCVVQAVVGYARPAAAPAAPATDHPSTPSSPEATDEEQDQRNSNPSTDEEQEQDQQHSNNPSADEEQDSTAKEQAKPSDDEQPSFLGRTLWVWFHRLTGMVLLGMAWYNCHTGIEWQVQNWGDDTWDWTSLFWGITVGISGLIFVLAYVMRL